MNAKAEQTNKSSAGDKLMLVLAVLVLAAGIFGFYWYANAAQVMRAGVLVGGLVLSAGIVMVTSYGRRIRHFLAESQFEMRKVVWPSRDETVKTTIIILIVVVILALLLGAIDLLLKTVVLEWLLKLGK